MAFERYKPRKRSSTYPLVTLGKAGIRFNNYCRKYIEGNPHCEIHYDRPKKILGIKFVPEESEYTFRILYYGKLSSWSVACRRFLMDRGIMIECGIWKEPVRIRAEWDGERGMLVADLSGIASEQKEKTG